MGRVYIYNPNVPIVRVGRTSRYGFVHFLGDALMTCLTGGIWLVWVIIREIRYR